MIMVRCPFNSVMSFVYRYKPNRNNDQVNILEVGSGTGNNLWYLAKEGFNVSGVELDERSIQYAVERFKEDHVNVNLIKGSFTELSFDDDSMDLIIDRGAITCVSLSEAKKTIREIYRVLKPEGKFYFNPFSEYDHRFLAGTVSLDGSVHNIYTDSQSIQYNLFKFYALRDIYDVFEKNWEILEFNQISRREIIKSRNNNSDCFEVIVKKI